MKKFTIVLASLFFTFFLAFAKDHPFYSQNFWKQANVEQVQKYIDQGIDINQPTNDGLTPLSFAVMESPNPSVIETLLKHGADIDALEAPFGWTPLFLASMSNPNPAVIETLLKHGAKINQRCIGISSTPLIDAVVHNPNPDIALTLVKHGANTELRDEDGYSAFDYVKLNKKLHHSALYQELKSATQKTIAQSKY